MVKFGAQFRTSPTSPIGSIARLNLAGVNQSAMIPAVRDALISCIMLVDAMDLYGAGFVANHTAMGRVKQHLADWCLILRALSITHRETIQRQLRNVLGDRYLTRLDPVMFYTMALSHFRRAVSMHGRGKTYRRVMNDMYLLEDDYKDNFYHFCCAIERMTVRDPGGAGVARRMRYLRLVIQTLTLTRPNRTMPQAARRLSGPTPLRYA